MGPILWGVALTIAALAGAATVRRSRAVFEERFPPISDAEFLARSAPGTDPRVALKVQRIAADHFATDYDRVHPSTRFIGDLGAD